MFVIIAVFLATLLLGVIMYNLYLIQRATSRMKTYSEKFPGPKALPFIGNTHHISRGLFATAQDLFQSLWRDSHTYGDTVRLWAGSHLFIVTRNVRLIELVLSSTEILDKGIAYKFLDPWLGTGLLTSSGKKWQLHRKILTPSFHFSMLEKFLDVFISNGNILIEKLSRKVGGPEFDIHRDIALYTLDNICEAAMGININAQTNESSEYVQAIKTMGNIVMTRLFRPWLHPDIFFNLTSSGRLQKKCLKILHGMTNKVIKARKDEILKNSLSGKNIDLEASGNVYGSKRRKNFLDMLLEATMNQSIMTDEEVREEVDTFMFEGHDTTSSAISFAIQSLGLHPEIQNKVYEEQLSIFGDTNREATYQDIQNMKYLEMVIKETLRLFPSVPMFARQTRKDIEFDNYIIPKGAHIGIVPFILHRDPELYSDPEKFDPERFSPENSKLRHPFQYVPFSAGSRNCIGMKFAMLELKSSLSKLIRNFRILPGSTTSSIEELTSEFIMKNINGIKISLMSRKS